MSGARTTIAASGELPSAGCGVGAPGEELIFGVGGLGGVIGGEVTAGSGTDGGGVPLATGRAGPGLGAGVLWIAMPGTGVGEVVASGCGVAPGDAAGVTRAGGGVPLRTAGRCGGGVPRNTSAGRPGGPTGCG